MQQGLLPVHLCTDLAKQMICTLSRSPLELSNALTVYDFCIIASGFACQDGMLESSIEQIIDEIPETVLGVTWAQYLPGSHIRIAVAPSLSVVLGIEKLLGVGDRELGSKVLNELMVSAKEINIPVVNSVRQLFQRHETWLDADLLIEQVVRWMLATAYLVSAKQSIRTGLGNPLNKQCQLGGCGLRFGECWRDAFGELWVIELVNGFSAFKKVASEIDLTSMKHPFFSIENYVSLNQAALEGFETVICELEDLVLSLDGTTYVEVEGCLFVQGTYGLIIQLGRVRGTSLSAWHVCTPEETIAFHFTPMEFVTAVKGMMQDETTMWLKIDPVELLCLDFENSSELVVVGALIQPTLCLNVDCNGPFVGMGEFTSGRDAILRPSYYLKWQTLSGSAQIGISASGPQGTLALGGEARRTGPMMRQDEILLAQSLTTEERAMRTSIFVYQAATGQVVEQNLYNMVRGVVAATFHQRSSVRISEVPMLSPTQEESSLCNMSGAMSGSLQRETLVRVCAAVISNPIPIFQDGTVGGLDLSALIETDEKVRIWEKPSKLPCWTAVLGKYPGVAVNRLDGSSPSIGRCSVFVTLAAIERRFGRLIRNEDSEECNCFSTESGITIQLKGLNSHVVRLAQMQAQTAITMRWDDSYGIYCPGQRFGSQRPSNMSVHTRLHWYPGLSRRTSGTRFTNLGLGEIVNGGNISAQFLGMMMECN